MTDEATRGLSDLMEVACRLGASKARVICTADISIEDDLADLCKEPRCESFGLAAGCPPYVAGPSAFRKFLKDFKQAVVFKLDVPSESLFSEERQDIFRLLHEIAAGIEQAAIRMGYRYAKAFAGGSCKRIFCRDQPSCRVVGEGGECRYPDDARPSMSGFGINVSRLMQVAGWTMTRAAEESTPGETSMVPVCGLVLVE
jgi:predicted metal-binding protein